MKYLNQFLSGSLRTLLLMLLIVVSVFAVTHFVNFPGSLASYMEITQGQKIFDMTPSFRADEVYERLQAMGETGRQAYARLILTIDFIFPVTAFLFLMAWTRFFSLRSYLKNKIVVGLSLMPLIYFAFDFIENISTLVLLQNYPDRITFIATALGTVTVLKKMAMMASFLLPLLIFGIRILRKKPLSNIASLGKQI